ncbi:hypothetical protein ACRRTK_000723 [Alexandromys fortis]
MLVGSTHFSLRASLSGSRILLSPSGLQPQQWAQELGCPWGLLTLPLHSCNQPGLCVVYTQTSSTSHPFPLLPGARDSLALGLFDPEYHVGFVATAVRGQCCIQSSGQN